MAKTILIAGAGANQAGLFSKARRLGIETVAVDGNPEAPGLVMADVAEVTDILDPAELARLARTHRVDGIFAAAELAVEAVAGAAKELGLPGVPPQVAERTRNKLAMRKALDAAGMPNPRYCSVDTAEAAREGAASVGFPLIVKPVDGNASKGVQRVESLGELAGAFENAHGRSRSGSVLLEAYMEGEEFCVDGLVYEGEYRLGGITGKAVSPLPYRFDLGIFMPPLKDQALCDSVAHCAAEALRAIGFTSGTTHVEVIVTDAGPRVVEIAGRPGGGRIPSDLIPIAYGQDFVADSLRIALGERPVERNRFERGVALYWVPAGPGRVQAITGTEEALALKGVREVVFQAKPGDRLEAIVDCVTRDSVGYVLAEGETAQEAVRTALAACELCRVITE